MDTFIFILLPTLVFTLIVLFFIMYLIEMGGIRRSIRHFFNRRQISTLSDKDTIQEPYRYTDELSNSKTTFACDRPITKLVELKGGKGIFPMGTKALWKVPPLDIQVKLAKSLKYVVDINDKLTKAKIKLGKRGTYDISMSGCPYAYRKDKAISYANPFIDSDSNDICLGNSYSLYERCWYSNNKYECLKVIKEVLSCSDDTDGYRRWKNCHL